VVSFGGNDFKPRVFGHIIWQNLSKLENRINGKLIKLIN
jgi:hypothetical protein